MKTLNSDKKSWIDWMFEIAIGIMIFTILAELVLHMYGICFTEIVVNLF